MITDERKKTGTVRLFFALWPDEKVRRQVARHRPLEGRLLRAEDWHITLCFIGAATHEQQSALELAAAGIKVAPFQLRLDYLDYWQRVKLTCLGVSEPPEPLLVLQEQLKSVAGSVGFSLEERRYMPHLSLSRGSPAVAKRSIEAIAWDARDFCLAESVAGSDGVEYKVRRRWPLRTL